MNRGAELDVRNAEGETPLYVAAAAGKTGILLKIVYLLIKCFLLCLEALSMLFLYGANTSMKAHNGNGIVHAAALSGEYETLLIIDKEDICDINSKNKSHDTPLHLICSQEKLPNATSIQFLLEKGASLDAK